MPITYTYQQTSVLTRIANDLVINANLDNPIFKFFPITPRNSMNLRWIIKDNFPGLMKLRGLGGEPTRINKAGFKVFETQAGAFGEFETVDEVEMTTRAAGFPADLSVPIDMTDMVAEAQANLTTRQYNRMRQMPWTLALTGTLSIALPGGGIGYTESYTPQTATVSPLWSTTATATPSKDLRSLQGTYGIGTSNLFGAMAEAWANSITWNYLLANTNANDLGGKRVEGGNTVNDLPGINRLLQLQGAPSINTWDGGYLDDSGTFQLDIPTGKVLVVAKRGDGETPGEFQITRNANNPDMGARAYAEVMDYTSGPARTFPPSLVVHQGFNGGCVIQRASQLVVLTVA